MVVIFAEVMPKTWALLRADRVALILAPSIVVTLAILGPMARGVAWISRFFLQADRRARRPHAGRCDEQADVLRGAIELHGEGQADEAAPAEKAMLRSVLDLGDRTVGDVMTHRGNVVLIDADQPIDAIVTQMLAAPYTRIPALSRRARQYRGRAPRQGPVPRRQGRRQSGGGQDRRRHDAALVHPRIDGAVRPAPGLPRPPRAFRHRRRRIRRAARHRDARGHHRGDRRRHRGRARRHQARRHRARGRQPDLPGRRADPRPQPRVRLGPARGRRHHHRRPGAARGPAHPRSRPDLCILRLPLRNSEARGHAHRRVAHRAAGRHTGRHSISA